MTKPKNGTVDHAAADPAVALDAVASSLAAQPQAADNPALPPRPAGTPDDPAMPAAGDARGAGAPPAPLEALTPAPRDPMTVTLGEIMEAQRADNAATGG